MLSHILFCLLFAQNAAKRRGPERIPAPKTAPPSHAFSYRPPEEFVPSAEEIEEWKKLPVSDRPYGEFIPRRYDSLRHVPAYTNIVRERFDRCLDLYMAPRVMRQRLNIDPESLIPKYVLRTKASAHHQTNIVLQFAHRRC